MRILTMIFILMAGAASAHPGHLIEVAGHGHWLGAGAIGLAILLGLWGKSKERAEPEEEELEEEAA